MSINFIAKSERPTLISLEDT